MHRAGKRMLQVAKHDGMTNSLESNHAVESRECALAISDDLQLVIGGSLAEDSSCRTITCAVELLKEIRVLLFATVPSRVHFCMSTAKIQANNARQCAS